MTDTRFQFVPYRGTGPALNDLIAGHIDLMFDQASNSIEHQVCGGTDRALAVTSWPQCPTWTAPPSLTLRRVSASGTAASEISISTQKAST